jgi:methylase of polypeptide subunit release factors
MIEQIARDSSHARAHDPELLGGLVLAERLSELVLADVNPAALELAAVNAALAGVTSSAVSFITSDVLAAVAGDIDLVSANPPYLVDGPGRLYRDGGGARGLELAVRTAEEPLARPQSGGQLVL